MYCSVPNPPKLWTNAANQHKRRCSSRWRRDVDNDDGSVRITYNFFYFSVTIQHYHRSDTFYLLFILLFRTYISSFSSSSFSFFVFACYFFFSLYIWQYVCVRLCACVIFSNFNILYGAHNLCFFMCKLDYRTEFIYGGDERSTRSLFIKCESFTVLLSKLCAADQRVLWTRLWLWKKLAETQSIENLIVFFLFLFCVFTSWASVCVCMWCECVWLFLCEPVCKSTSNMS